MRDHFVLFDEGPNGRPVVFSAPSQVISAQRATDVAPALVALDAAQRDGKWIAGYAAYELGYALEPKLGGLMPDDRIGPLLVFGVFDGPDECAAKTMLRVGAAKADDSALLGLEPVWPQDAYNTAFSQVKDYIAAGDIYQVNLTFPIRGGYAGTALGLYAQLRARQPVSHGAMVDLGIGPVLLSRSPELFFRNDGRGRIETRPMKGTMPRGKTAAEDEAFRAFLSRDLKNRAENLMIVDLLRNDISRVSVAGSVEVPELFAIETYATVHQMVSTISAQLVPGTSLAEIIRALFPCGSITGAPKIRAMEIIRELEPLPRNAYCGAIGWAEPDGVSSFNVAIRTLSLFEDRSVTLNVGGGVVHDSTAASEYEEALWKARYARPKD